MDIFQFATEADNYDDLEPWSQGGVALIDWRCN